MNDKNALQRAEADLNMRAKELELESQHSNLQRALRSRMSSNTNRNFAELQEEQKIIEQMLSVVQERDRLVTQLEMERRRLNDISSIRLNALFCFGFLEKLKPNVKWKQYWRGRGSAIAVSAPFFFMTQSQIHWARRKAQSDKTQQYIS